MKLFFRILMFTSFLILSEQTYASSMMPLNLKQITSMAQIIIKGEVTDIRNIEENNQIVSYITFDVSEVLKGSVATDQPFVFSQPVSLGSPFQNTTNVPKYKVGKTYVLFLPTQSESTIAPIGGSQGVFEIQNGQIPTLKQHKAMLKRNLNLQNSTRQDLVNAYLSSDNTDTTYNSFAQCIQTILQDLN